MPENKFGRTVGRISNAIVFSAVQESFIALALAYFLSLIYLIGDTRQLTPLLLGVIVGTVIFATLSTLLGKFSRGKFAAEGILVAALLSISAYLSADLLILKSGYQNSDLFLALIGSLIISPILLVQHYSQEVFKIGKRVTKVIVSSSSSVIMILIVLIFSIIYEEAGQTMLSAKVEITGIIALLLTLLEIGIIKRL